MPKLSDRLRDYLYNLDQSAQQLSATYQWKESEWWSKKGKSWFNWKVNQGPDSLGWIERVWRGWSPQSLCTAEVIQRVHSTRECITQLIYPLRNSTESALHSWSTERALHSCSTAQLLHDAISLQVCTAELIQREHCISLCKCMLHCCSTRWSNAPGALLHDGIPVQQCKCALIRYSKECALLHDFICALLFYIARSERGDAVMVSVHWRE